MTRTIATFATMLLLLLAGTAAVADAPRFATPDTATEVLQAPELAVALHYESDRWSVSKQRTDYFALLARVIGKDGWVSGAFVYRDEPSTREAVKDRVRAELKTAFDSYEIHGFSRRVVNGTPVMFLKASAMSSGDELVIRTYYWIGPEAVADYSVVTKRKVFEKYREPMMDLLNGLEIAAGEPDASSGE